MPLKGDPVTWRGHVSSFVIQASGVTSQHSTNVPVVDGCLLNVGVLPHSPGSRPLHLHSVWFQLGNLVGLRVVAEGIAGKVQAAQLVTGKPCSRCWLGLAFTT